MAIRFAGHHPALSAGRTRYMAVSTLGLPANDNGSAIGWDAMLHAALRHFAEHGLAAAAHAKRQAEAALSCGDSDSYKWWLEICRTLDRRLASAVAMPARN